MYQKTIEPANKNVIEDMAKRREIRNSTAKNDGNLFGVTNLISETIEQGMKTL